MKLEEGMYVRTSVDIGKIINFDGDLINIDLGYRTTIDYKSRLFDIKKASYNIIDLIETGDYVNGYEVDFVQNGYVVFNYNHPRQALIYPKDIKSIVTKEQFESMQYKVD